MSPEDVFEKFKEIAKRDPTENEFNDAWEQATKNAANSYIMDGFWENIAQACESARLPDEELNL